MSAQLPSARPGGDAARQRTISSLLFRGGGGMLQVVVVGLRSIVLARLLPVEVFGIYAGARVGLALVSTIFEGGLTPALIRQHRTTEDEDRAAGVNLLLRTVLTSTWALGALVVALQVAEDGHRTAALVLTATFAVDALLTTPAALLRRRVVHRRLALLGVSVDLASSAVAVVLAFAGVELWALLSTHVVASVVGVILLYLYRPVWRAKLRWDREVAVEMLRFGAGAGLANTLDTGLDRLDDLYVAGVLGTTPMGFYNRAFTFARYPSKIAGAPINDVSFGAISAAENRTQRTEVFDLLMGTLIRVGFLLAGVLFVAAPEMVQVLIGARWLPMLDAFRLMLVYALLDPLKRILGHVLLAADETRRLVMTKLLQLAILGAGLLLLGSRGIGGVALGVDLMALVGTVVLLRQVRDHVDVDLRSLLGAPLLALGVAIASAFAAREALSGLLPVLLGTAVIFTLAYAGVLAVLERQRVAVLVGSLRRLRARRRSTRDGADGGEA